ncbi:MAG: hypothetical protein Q9164_002788 [Protoblastenia rupestris]
MSGLVDYGSSDEEEQEIERVDSRREISPKRDTHHGSLNPAHSRSTSHPVVVADTKLIPIESNTNGISTPPPAPSTHSEDLSTSTPRDGPTLGPSLGSPQPSNSDLETASTPTSPYTRTRSALRSLTLPQCPELDIPSAAGSSPPRGLDEKIVHFLSLKKRGVHFNGKLASSSALKNPSLLPKLMAAAGLDGDGEGGGKVEYVTTLPSELWDPSGWPAWAYAEGLDRSQKEIATRKEGEGLGKQREFVAGTSDDRLQGSRNTVGLNAAERVMAGLDGEGRNSTAAADGKGMIGIGGMKADLRSGRGERQDRYESVQAFGQMRSG